jgi:hypothetical protein
MVRSPAHFARFVPGFRRSEEHIRSPNVGSRRRILMVRRLAFLAALFAMGFTAHAQDDPGALSGVYGPSQAFPTPTGTKGRPASQAPAPSLAGVYAPGEIAPGTSVTPPSRAVGPFGVTAPMAVVPGLAGVYAPGQAPPASRTAVVAPNGAIVGTGQSFTMWSAPGFGQISGPIPGSRIYPFPGSQGGPLSVGQALPLNIVPTPLPDQPGNGVAVVNGHRLILERGTNRIIQDLD